MCITHLFAHQACNHTTPNLPFSLASHCAALDAALRFYHTQPDRPPLQGGMVMPRVCGLEESTAESDSEPLHPQPYVGAVQIWPVPWGCGRAGHGPCRTGWGSWWCPWVCGETLRERARVSVQMGNAREGRAGDGNRPGWSGDVNRSVGYPGWGRAPWNTYGAVGGNWTSGNGSGNRGRSARGGDFVARGRASVRVYRTRGRETERGFRDGDQEGGGITFSGVCGGPESVNKIPKEGPVLETHSTALGHGREDRNRAGSPGFNPTPEFSSPLFRRSRTASLPSLRSSPPTASTALLTARPQSPLTNGDAEAEFWGWGLWIDNATGEIARWSAESREPTGCMNEGIMGSTEGMKRGKNEENENDQANERDEGVEHIPTNDPRNANQCSLLHTPSLKPYYHSTIANPRAEVPSSVFAPAVPRYNAMENMGTRSRMKMTEVEVERVAPKKVRMICPGKSIVDGGC